jgi:hypothetical protein
MAKHTGGGERRPNCDEDDDMPFVGSDIDIYDGTIQGVSEEQ